MARKPTAKQAAKALRDQISAYYSVHGDRRVINIMNISKIYTAGEKAAAEGRSVEEAVMEAVARWTAPEGQTPP